LFPWPAGHNAARFDFSFGDTIGGCNDAFAILLAKTSVLISDAARFYLFPHLLYIGGIFKQNISIEKKKMIDWRGSPSVTWPHD
jgi:type III secretory pathway component EscV